MTEEERFEDVPVAFLEEEEEVVGTLLDFEDLPCSLEEDEVEAMDDAGLSVVTTAPSPAPPPPPPPAVLFPVRVRLDFDEEEVDEFVDDAR